MPTPPPPPAAAAAAVLDRVHFELAPMVDAGEVQGWRPAAPGERPTAWSLYRLVQVLGPDGRAYLERRHVLDCPSARQGAKALRLAQQLLEP